MRRTSRSYLIVAGVGLALGLLAAGPAPDIMAGARNRPGPLDKLSWLVGCWRLESARGTVVQERWRLLPGDTLWGASATTRGDSLIDSERMHIVARGEILVYVAEPLRQRRTEFTATTVRGTLAVFENPRHDFPQRIVYRPSGDSLYARVDGVVNGSVRALDFPMRRAECTSQ